MPVTEFMLKVVDKVSKVLITCISKQTWIG